MPLYLALYLKNQKQKKCGGLWQGIVMEQHWISLLVICGMNELTWNNENFKLSTTFLQDQGHKCSINPFSTIINYY